MNERAKISRKKGTASDISYPSLAPKIPSLHIPAHDSNLQSATPAPETVQREISQEQENQENISLKQDSFLGNINYLENISIHRPQQAVQRQDIEKEKEKEKEDIEQGEIVQAKLNTLESAGKQKESSPLHKAFQPQGNLGNSNIQLPDSPLGKINYLEKISIHRLKETVQRQEFGEEEQQEESELVQTKLTIGEPGDKYEQEADRVASQVVQQINTPTSTQSPQGQSLQRTEAQEEEEIQAKPEITIDDLLKQVQIVKENKGWNGKNYGDTWQCNDISNEVSSKVEGCSPETIQGHVLVKGGKIPGGERSGNTNGLQYWYFESYHQYVKHESLGSYDPTFERLIEEEDILNGEKQEYDDIEYYKFADNLFGTPGNSQMMNLFNTLEQLKEAVADKTTDVGKFWNDSESEAESP